VVNAGLQDTRPGTAMEVRRPSGPIRVLGGLTQVEVKTGMASTDTEQDQVIESRRQQIREHSDRRRPRRRIELVRPSMTRRWLRVPVPTPRSKREAADRQPGSWWLHRLGKATAHAGAGLLAAGAVFGWTVVGAVTEYPAWWQTVLYSVSASITVVMVFAIQHTQARQQSATQRKLDELLRALPAADNRLIATEGAPDDELKALAELNDRDRDHAHIPHR